MSPTATTAIELPVHDTGPDTPPPRYTVVYDENCELCRRCRHWLGGQPTLVELTFLAAGSPEAASRYGHLPWYRIELMVVNANGMAWTGAGAFIMCMWATVKYRPLSHRIRSPHFAPLATWFFHTLSANRGVVSGMLKSHHCSDGVCGTVPGTA